MSWYYISAGQRVGPITPEEFERLVQAGTIQPDTLVWQEGMANWESYATIRPAPPVVSLEPPGAAGVLPTAAGPESAAGESHVVCAECQRFFSRDNVIQYGQAWVCAECKPVFLQRLAEGAPLPRSGLGWVNEAELLAREYVVDLGGCLERAWKLFAGRAGLIIGATLLVGLIFAAGTVISILAGTVVPLADSVLPIFYTGPLAGGLGWFFVRLARGEDAMLGDAFAGFGPRFGQLLLCSIVQGLFSLLCMLPMGIMAGLLGFTTAAGGGGGVSQSNPTLLVLLPVFAVLGAAGVVYLTTIWTFSYLLIMDKRMSFWPAMQLSRRLVSKRWWMTFLFLLVAGLIFGVGFLFCLVGALLTGALFYGMWVCLYDDNFRDLAPQPV